MRNAVADSRSRHDHQAQHHHDQIEATWRERALNAEAELTRAQKEILTQRQRVGELMGQIRDFDQMVPGESVQALVTENTTLKHRVQQLTREHRTLQERLEGARSNLRFAEKRTADLEGEIVSLQQAAGPSTSERGQDSTKPLAFSEKAQRAGEVVRSARSCDAR